MNRDDFPILKSNLIYFDNGATTLKPKAVITAMDEYYTTYTANAHRGDYDNSLKVDQLYESARKTVKDFINANSVKEIIFTSGTTDSLNRLAFGLVQYQFPKGEILITKSEHASNVLPWFELGLKVRYIDLDEHHEVTLANVKKAITKDTKVIALAAVTNVIGDVRPIKAITAYAHQRGIMVIVDGAQSVPHFKVNVQALDVDALAFSSHKMLGGTGTGVLYIKESLLPLLHPTMFGGGMNASFEADGTRLYDESPQLYEAGTQNIAGVIGLRAAIQYLDAIGMNQIHTYELELRTYLIKGLKQNKNIIIYNEMATSGIVTFNYQGVFAQDLAIYLNKYHIAIRSGNHCAKMLKDELEVKNTCRISLYFYNTKAEIDVLLQALNNPHLKEELI